MCDLCDQPDLTMDSYVDHLRDRLTRERFVVQSVQGSVSTAELGYSVGLTAHGLPELVVVGARPDDARQLLEQWGAYLVDESLVLPGERCVGPLRHGRGRGRAPRGPPRARCRDLRQRRPRSSAGLGRRPGQVPWEAGHRARRAGQPLLGKRAPWYCDEHRTDRLDVPPHL